MLIALGAMCFAVPAGSADRSLEHSVKASFLYKLASFVEWPAGSFESETSPFNLCVFGADPFGGRIEEAVRGQSVGRHPIVLRYLKRAEPRSNCHAIFVSGSGRQDVSEALNAVDGRPVLTVTDSALGPAAGIVHFVIVDDRVGFDIDLAAATRNRLVISSKVLELARKVNRARPAGNR